MPSIDAVQQYFVGAWRLMMGKADGLRLLDLSADGFWNSFYAIVLALPPMIFSWVSGSDTLDPLHADLGGRLGVIARFAVVDLSTWVVPVVALALIARPAGIADRFVHYVVATNWSSALLLWLTVPLPLLRLVLPDQIELAEALSYIIFLGSIYFSWRVTSVSLGKGAAVGTAVFAGMFAISVFLFVMLQTALGLVLVDQVPAA